MIAYERPRSFIAFAWQKRITLVSFNALDDKRVILINTQVNRNKNLQMKRKFRRAT